MKILQINTFPYKATGNIMLSIHRALKEASIESYVVWGRGRDGEDESEIVIKDEVGTIIHGLITRITDKTGFSSSRATTALLRKIKEINPDIIHLHNVHGYYLNIEMLFKYIKDNEVKVVWTMHDCWPITGHCAYFDMVACKKWINGCYSCPQKRTYPTSLLFDASKWNWKKKKELFSGLNLTVITPSKWLQEIMKESFLGYADVKVINNGIDTDIYKPVSSSKYQLKQAEGKKLILGVASEWTERKGLHDFYELRKLLANDEYAIALVGLTEKQVQELPDGLIGIKRTQNVEELVSLYSQAAFFINPTYEDNFPTTNLEAIACGTAVITYQTGGSPETIEPGTGYVVEKGNVEEIARIIKSSEFKMVTKIDVKYTKKSMIQQYINIYNLICCKED